MNKKNHFFSSLLIAALLISADYVAAANHTNKTYLSGRPVGHNLAMETAGFNALLESNTYDSFGADFQTTYFYSRSTNAKAVGKYFGMKNKNSFTMYYNNAADIHTNTVYQDSSALTAETSVAFRPVQCVQGTSIQYQQNLDNILDDLWIRIKLPMVKVTNNMYLDITGSNINNIAALNNYFNGLIPSGSTDIPLRNAIIDGKHEAAGFGDLSIDLGYDLVHRERYSFGINLGLIIPTGTKTNGTYLWEAVTGNNGHWEVGAGAQLAWHAWHKREHMVDVLVAAHYHYGLQASEKHNFGLKETDLGLFRQDDTINNQPTANISTIDAYVTPGHMIDALVGLSYNFKEWNIDMGYNFFYKDAADVSARGALPQPSVAALDLNSIAAASMSHSLYGSINYMFTKFHYPMLVGFGGHYEFAQDNGALENWGLNIKTGFSF